jgi:hypothetical protein
MNASGRVGTALTSGADSTTFDRSKGCLPILEKLEIKYGWKKFEIRNNFTYRNFSRFEKEFELKFRELL